MQTASTPVQAPPPLPARVQVAIIGSGFAGLCMAIQLKQDGIDDFVILEKDQQFGGTWRVNDYPGAACDVPSHLYSFSFAQNPHWSRRFPRQSELLAYTEQLVRDYALAPQLHLATALTGATYDEAGACWQLDTSAGPLRASTLVLASGSLSRPSIAAIPGLASFKGKVFHSAQWEHDYALRGKRVALIGNGASAVQFVPEIVAQVARLDLYQRSAHWILPRPDRAMTRVERWLLAHVPPLQWLYRAINYVSYEMRFVGFATPPLMKLMGFAARRHLRRQIPLDAALREKLTPDYTMGCKRILLTSDYYPALTRPNVNVLTESVAAIDADGVRDVNGVHRAVDAIIFATGFDVQHALGTVAVRGRAGRLLSEVAGGELEAYKGASVPGFPNLFMITGPNTGVGHNSMIYMIESGVRYVIKAQRHMRSAGLRSVEVKADVARNYNAALQKRLQGTVWQTGCHSWYLSGSGKNNTLWPGFTFEYRRQTRHFDAANYLTLA